MALEMDECLVCLEKCISSKKLRCKHYFCLPCLEKLASEKIPLPPPTGPEDGSRRSSEGSLRLTHGFRCPTCREVTPIPSKGVAKLKTKFFTPLHCPRCEIEKSVDEFRWCLECEETVCSRCFLDKHVISKKGRVETFHPFSVWEEYDGVRLCLEQLKQMVTKTEKERMSAREHAKSYAAELLKHLLAEVDAKASAGTKIPEEWISDIADAYGVDPDGVAPKEHPPSKFAATLREVHHVAGLGPGVAELATTKLFCHTVPFHEISTCILSPQTKSLSVTPRRDYCRISGADESDVIEAKALRTPVDFCLLDDGTLLCADADAGECRAAACPGQGVLTRTLRHRRRLGVFAFRDPWTRPVGPPYAVSGCSGYAFMTRVPGAGNTVMVSVQMGADKLWYYHFLTMSDAGTITGFKTFNYLPSGEPARLASSNSKLFALSQKALHVLGGLKEEHWTTVYTAPDREKLICSLGPVIDKGTQTEVFLAHPDSQSVEIITVNTDKNSAVGRRLLLTDVIPNCPVLHEPFVELWDEEKEEYVVGDREQGTAYLWEKKKGTSRVLVEFEVGRVRRVLRQGSCAFTLLEQGTAGNRATKTLEWHRLR